MQASDFLQKYKILTLSVNEDTDQTESRWKRNVFNPHVPRGKLGLYQHLIVTPEQFFKLKEGYLSRFGLTIRDRNYTRHLGRSQQAFRPAYGRLNEIKIMSGFASIPWHALTATAPPHVYDHIISAVLKHEHSLIRYTSHRPNTIYATHRIIGNLDDMYNYDMFLKFTDDGHFDFASQPRIVLFFDNKNLCKNVRNHLMELLPTSGLPHPRDKIVQYYRGNMSSKYLQQCHEDFVSDNGPCRIYCTTKSNSTGIDFPHVDIVVNVGLPPDACESLQRGGRVVRRPGRIGLYLVLYETWVDEIDTDTYTDNTINEYDPDRPRAPLKEKSTRQERAPYSMVSMMQSCRCIRELYAKYLDDKAENALFYNGSHCCDRHDDGFNLQTWIPGKILTRVPEAQVEATKTTERNKYRMPTTDRPILEQKLLDWREQLPEKLKTPDELQQLVVRSAEWKSEWAQTIINVVTEFDAKVVPAKRVRANQIT
ncbi:hypothetical protein MPER_08829 [Moniliophthora perniciosa FA553]|nr:hypothetical protein MPER_08829 [Moniliophthora perniciosa FA553]